MKSTSVGAHVHVLICCVSVFACEDHVMNVNALARTCHVICMNLGILQAGGLRNVHVPCTLLHKTAFFLQKPAPASEQTHIGFDALRSLA